MEVDLALSCDESKIGDNCHHNMATGQREPQNLINENSKRVLIHTSLQESWAIVLICTRFCKAFLGLLLHLWTAVVGSLGSSRMASGDASSLLCTVSHPL